MLRLKMIAACAAVAMLVAPTGSQAAGYGHGHWGHHHLPVSTWFLALGAWGLCTTGNLMIRAAIGDMATDGRYKAHMAMFGCVPIIGPAVLNIIYQPMPGEPATRPYSLF